MTPKVWRDGHALSFDPFDSDRKRWFQRASQRLGWPGWLFYLIVRGIGANITCWRERRRGKDKR